MVAETKTRILIVLCSACLTLSCDRLPQWGSSAGNGDGDAADASATTATQDAAVEMIERDVEAPDIFQVADRGLWDGRPSFGGIWVAHADVSQPERVVIVNEDNGKSVTGVVFRRERDNPGPKFQVSSAAAASLDMLPGAPARLKVTALRREQVPVVPALPEAPFEALARDALIEAVQDAEAETAEAGTREVKDAETETGETDTGAAPAVSPASRGPVVPTVPRPEI